MFLYAIKDVLANRCGPVFQAVNDKVANRSMRQLLEKVDPIEYPEFKLYLLGTYDEVTGTITGVPEPIEKTEYLEVKPNASRV